MWAASFRLKPLPYPPRLLDPPPQRRAFPDRPPRPHAERTPDHRAVPPPHGENPDALVEARRAEFRETAAALRAVSVQHLGYPDGNIPSSAKEVERLRLIVRHIQPDVVLLPWFLDGHVDHRRANLLYALACGDLEAAVLGYEIWSMLEPNAVFDITKHLVGKLSLIRNYPSQLRTVDYVRYASGLANVRAYQAALQPLRSGAAEAFLALPNREYCELVCELYGAREELRDEAAQPRSALPMLRWR
jgi:LmbE family N-acetylglucosaminyl deacetylase